MLRFLRHFFIVLGFVLVAGCTGGGCSSGCSCAGVTPLPLGFDQDQRIQNAASVRLTDSGLEFLEQNLGTLVSSLMGPDEGGSMTFPIENMSGAFNLGIDLVSYEICPGGPDEDADPPRCVAEIDLANAQLQLDPAAPHNIQIHGPLPLRIQNLPIHVTYLFIFNDDTTMALNGNDECPNNAQTFADINLNVDISIEIDGDPGHSRVGYSRVRILDVSADEGNLSDSIHFCGGGFTSAIFNGLKGVLIPLLMDSLIGTLGSTIEEQLCQPANPDLDPSCPAGTEDVGGICRYGPDGDAECASVLLGMDGNVDLGAMLASFSPGTQGAFDFVFAAGGHGLRDDGTGFHWGDLDPLGAGITLGMYGGTEPRPLSPCVPLDERPFPEGIPIPDELHQNVLDGWPSETAGPHFGMAISERFFNYALAQLYNSGALCLGINGDTIPQLNTNLLGLGLGAPSMAELGRMKDAAPVALVIRPQRPPHVEFGNGTDVNADPLIHLTMEQLAIDFYAWSIDRYIRAMTVTVDIDVPANLMVTPEGLQPVLETIGLANAVVSNNGLLREDPAAVAAGIQELVGTMIGGLLGDAIPPVDLDGALADFGMRLVIPPTEEGQGSAGLRMLTKGDDDFLGIFAALELAVAADSVQADTSAELAGLDLGSVGPTWTALRDDGAPAAAEPVAELRLGSSLDDGTRSMQWQVRIDRQPWRPFSSERTVELRGHWLLQQGQHVVQVRSRVAGDAFSLDPTPAEVVLRVDDEPPAVRVRQDAEGWIDVRAGDRVSPDGRLSVRQRFGSGSRDDVTWEPWSDWIGLDALEMLDPAEADWIEVQVQDEEGNVGTVQQALIRGRGNVDASGCQCSLPGPSAPGGASAWLAALLLGAGAVYRRRRPRKGLRTKGARPSRAGASIAAGLALVLLGGLWSGCSCSGDDETGSLGCRGRGDCLLLEPGLVGAYSSAAVAPDGVLWVAGYLEANWADDLPFGDLVVGTHDGNEVRWTVVDGVPSEPAVDTELYDPQGFRGGQIEAGEDVGLWTSLAIAPDGMPAVAYYDATNRALRYAHRQADGWSVTVVDERDYADLGRYAKLLFVDGRPVIAYLFIQPGEGGEVHSGVRLATGSAAPASEAQWSFADAVVEPATPCRAAFCRPGTRCVLGTGRCEQTTNDCASDCGGSDECVQIEGTPQCEEVASSSALESYPDAMGLYVSAVPDPAGGVGLAFYDRIRGNVVVARPDGGQWATVIADGEADGADSGDMGIGTSLAIDGAGHYHVAYVDGGEEALRYVTVLDGTTPAVPEVADDGYGIEGQLFGDGKHIVGDDAHIFVTQGGDIRISYQDASAGTLRIAVGSQATDGHDWTLSIVAQDGFAGFFSRQIEIDGALRLLNWWRVASPAARGNVRLLSP